ncbi:MAG TPA: protein-disulfide reductase DsbD domain-containing protein [Candidatus Acidoferrales bacterium]|nr:protein-disulfide reductase DsbD domain-containing protein [Candidatus Acidoferrales bacterium]
MKRSSKFSGALLAAALFTVSAAASRNSISRGMPQSDSSLPAASSVAKPHAFVSLDEVPAGHSFEVAIVVDILTGYHMNSHTPTESYLIPTTISLAPPPGIRDGGTSYPDGQLLKFDFSPEKLSVYSGSVTILAKLSAEAGAAPGEVTLPFTLRYQACNMSACLPPVKISVPVKVKVGSAGAKPHELHPEIFKKT